ncbi:MAG: DUF349 domain-containing protein [Paludibacter sp.]|nr:DUF349 domain-containing protein [Paludibacter sp.]
MIFLQTNSKNVLGKMETPEFEKVETNPEETQSVAEILAQTSDIEQITKRIEYPILTEQPLAEEVPLVVENEKEERKEKEKAEEVEKEEEKENTQNVSLLPQDVEIEIENETISENAVSNTDFTKEELVEKLQDLVNQSAEPKKSEVDAIKLNFFHQIGLEKESLREKFISDGGTLEDFKPQKDDLEDTFRELLAQLKARRIAHAAQFEKQKEQNLLEKQHIIEQMRTLVEQNSDVDKAVSEFRELQQKWKTIGGVPMSQANILWRDYSQCQEAFWDLVKINNELRDYDFRKNLEAKNALIDAATKLENEKDVISAFKKLQKLHEEWREIGPVPREMREEIWKRFKEASALVNKRQVEYFETLRKNEEENTAKKKELIEKIINFDISNLKSFKQWDDASNQVHELQTEWRSIGFAPRRLNQKLFEKYRKASDDFFSAKSAFFKEMRSEFSANIEKKVLLCKQAEELKDSQDWHKTSLVFINLQKQWRDVGSVPRKLSDTLWERFLNACNYFFEQKKNATTSQASQEKENLIKKRDIIEQIKSLDTTNESNALKSLKEIIVEWNSIGFVPFREKTQIYREYRTAINTKFDALNVDENARRLDNFRNNVANLATKGSGTLQEEHKKLTRAYERMRQELKTYENNLGFFTSSSKNGGGIIEQMNKKIDNLRSECKLLQEKIKLIAHEIK